MDFDFSEDQLALREGACELLDDLASPERVRAHTATNDAFDSALWTAMAEQGWLAIEVPEAEGGIGLGTVELAILVEEMGRHSRAGAVRARGARHRHVRAPPVSSTRPRA